METHRKGLIMIIGICSFSPQVGKTTCATYLKDKYKFEYVEMSSEITKFCRRYLGYNGDKFDPNQRKILQDVGKLWKDLYPDIWLYHNLGSLHATKDPNIIYETIFEEYVYYKDQINTYGISEFFPNGIIVSGIRSKAEADAIRSMGGKVYLVERNIDIEGGSHPVENDLFGYKKFNGLISNDQDIPSLYKKIEKLIFKKRISSTHIMECPYTGISIPSYQGVHDSVKEISKKFNIDFCN